MTCHEHELKTDPKYFQAVWEGNKTFEFRKADRDFTVGDSIRLKETRYSRDEMDQGAPLDYTGRYIHAETTYILPAGDWAILAIRIITQGDEQ